MEGILVSLLNFGTGLTLLPQTNKNVRLYRGADKSLARPGRKEATATEDFVVHISYL
jgi:hypothetical protein